MAFRFKRLTAALLSLLLFLPAMASGARAAEADLNLAAKDSGYEAAASATDSVYGSNSVYVRLKNEWKGVYLYEAEGQVRYGFTAVNDPASQWEIKSGAGGAQLLVNRATGHLLNRELASDPHDNLKSSALGSDAASAQWEVTEAAGKPGYVNLSIPGSPKQLVNIQVLNGYAQVSDWAQPGWGSALWQVEPGHDLEPVRLVDGWKGKVLYEEAGQAKYGTPELNDASSQWFVVDGVTPGSKRFVNRATGHVLNRSGNDGDRLNDPVKSSDLPDASTAGDFSIQEQGGAAGLYTIASSEKSSYLLHVQSQTGYAQISDWAQPGWGSSSWRLEPAADSAAKRLQDSWKGSFLQEQDGLIAYGAPDYSDASSQWIVEDFGTAVRLRNVQTGRYMQQTELKGGAALAAAAPQAADPLLTSWIQAPGRDGSGDVQSGQSTFQAASDGDAYLNVQSQDGYAHGNNWAQPSWGSARWLVKAPAPEGPAEELTPYVKIRNDWLQLYLFEKDGKLAYGNVQPGDESAHWLIETKDGVQHIVNRATGHYVTLSGLKPDSRESVRVADPEGDMDSAAWTVLDHQGFKLIRSAGDTRPAEASGYLNVEHKLKAAEYSPVNRDWGSPKWEFIPVKASETGTGGGAPAQLPDGAIRLTSKSGGAALYENAGGVVLYGNLDAKDLRSHWSVKERAEGGVSIVNEATGRELSWLPGVSYLGTVPAVGSGSNAAWALESAPAAGAVLLRSLAEGHEDEYAQIADGLGYAQLDLRSIDNGAVQWVAAEAPEGGYIPAVQDTVGSGMTPSAPHSGLYRLQNSAAGSLLAMNGDELALSGGDARSKSALWRMEDRNGRLLLRNEATGSYLLRDGDGSTVSAGEAGPAAEWTQDKQSGLLILAEPGGSRVLSAASGHAALAERDTAGGSGRWKLLEAAGDVVYEAEKGFVSGGAGIHADAPGYAGRGYVSGWKDAADRLILSVQAQAAGLYEADWTAGVLAGGDAGSLSLYVNGLPQGKLGAAAGAGNGMWRTIPAKLKLRAGYNSVELRKSGDDAGGLLVDRLLVHGAVSRDYRGATLPYTTYEAEDGTTTGTVLGPDRTYMTLASEASGRKAVKLDASGQYVEFKLAEPASYMSLRYSIPDSADGSGQQATLSYSVDGTPGGKLELSSRHAWVYGKYPWSNNPEDGDPHRFYDETQLDFGRTLPAGSVLRLEKQASDAAAYYVLDSADLELAPAAYAMPEGFLSVTDFGAAPNDGKSDYTAFLDAVKAAKAAGKGVWVPQGMFRLDSPLEVQGIAIRGAGMWHTTIEGAGFMGTGDGIGVYDLKIDVGVTGRHDELREAAFDGTFGKGSTIQGVWVEHAKAGIWSVRSDDEDGGIATDGLYAAGMRIRDTYADGINFSTGTANSMAEQNAIRNTGDDSIAIWSSQPDGVSADDARASGNTIRFNTVQLPWLADNVAIFGGSDNKVQDNILSDTVGFGAGIAVSTRFNPVAFGGRTVVERNTLIRTGGHEFNWNQDFGAIWLFTGDKPIDADIDLLDNTVLDSTFQGLYINGAYPFNASGQHRILIRNLVLDGMGTWGIHAGSGISGSVQLDQLQLRGAKVGPFFNASGSAFQLALTEQAPPAAVLPVDGYHTGEGLTWDSQPDPGTGLPTPTPTSTASPTPAPTGAATPTPAPTGAATPTPASTSTATPTPSPTGTATPTPGAGSPASNQEALAKAAAAKVPSVQLESSAVAGGGRAAELPLDAFLAYAEAMPLGTITLQAGSSSITIPASAAAKLAAMRGQADTAGAVIRIELGAADQQAFAAMKLRASALNGNAFAGTAAWSLSMEQGGRSAALTGGIGYVDLEFPAGGGSKPAPNAGLLRTADGSVRAVPASFAKGADGTIVRIRTLGTGSFGTAALPSKSFRDTAGSWASADIERLSAAGILNGISAERYAPGQAVSRADFAALISRALGLDLLAGGEAEGQSWTDGKPGSAWTAAAAAVRSAGIMQGGLDGSFRPVASVTRQEMAVILNRAILFAAGGQPHNTTDPASQAQASVFTDAAKISPWAADSITALAARGMLRGMPDGAFHPLAPVTRAEAAALLGRLLSDAGFIGS
ncbi:S-layer homology domain-containing protein [Paenibacillus humicus]|uniref:S-layer homology domain-containing protein n=1 Tax=Paenibacillus humicus TaxID=412861 RepID=UPI000FD7A774|nr:S-layer homology domain-containing protein [Paenibacillus humicus]